MARIATLALGIVAVGLGITFKGQNVAFMVSLAFALAASGNFPVLILSLYWPGMTTCGAVVGGTVGLGLALILTILSPAVWVTTLGNAAPLFPYSSPAIFSVPAAFLAIWLVSRLDRSARGAEDRAGFADQEVRSETGIGAFKASGH